MKAIFTGVLVFVIISCSSQDGLVDIRGNWYLAAANSEKESPYIEIFLSNNEFHSFDDSVGYKGSHYYILENDNIFYFIINKERIKAGKVKFVDKNTISINMEEGDRMIAYKRIPEGEITLEDFIFKNPYDEELKMKLEADYIKAFNKRKRLVPKTLD